MAIAWLWEHRRDAAGEGSYSFTMLTLNADEHARLPLVFAVLRQYFTDDADRQQVIALQDKCQLSAYGLSGWQAPAAQVFHRWMCRPTRWPISRPCN
ncbi:hypothetical protein PS726_01826 [Pseudomonas fluorescens]|nr:hypothetical protein BSF40_19030 [Pseudomonas sp. ACN5]VVM61233.1 hypothetical protein PS647_01309 [Pseudomonas fluorescens]VVN90337.1 hypothetical protein PS726_01826 [Pseudomonas fluorescens]VVO55790.1 hypothetical protein PS843_00519 [Pseudomonas fluorescens]